MYRLDLEALTPEELIAMKEFARELVSKGGSTDEPRAPARRPTRLRIKQTPCYRCFRPLLLA
jgi:hypothetical protein